MVSRYLAGIILALGMAVPAWAGGLPLLPEQVDSDQSVAHQTVQYPPLPAGFNPLTASDADLAAQGLPPRPDPQRAPEAYRHWQKVVTLPRVTGGNVIQTKHYHGLFRQAPKAATLQGATGPLPSINWSGYAVNVPPGTFTTNGSEVSADWVVPIAQQAPGVCDIPGDYSSQWIGFDGAQGVSTDLLQAGTEAASLCTGSARSPQYYAWFEWVPFGEIVVEQPLVQPGDLISEWLWYTTTPPFGHALIANVTLGLEGAYAFNPPPGTIFEGDSVEWVLERGPAIVEPSGPIIPNLPNYTADQFANTQATNQIDNFTPGQSPDYATTFAITMVCPPWNPATSCPVTSPISTPNLYGNTALWFFPSFPAQ